MDQNRGQCQCSRVLNARNMELAAVKRRAEEQAAQLEAERQRSAQMETQLAEVKAEMAALREMNDKLREELRKEKEDWQREKEKWQRRPSEEVNVQLRASLEARVSTTSEPEKPPPLISTFTPATSPLSPISQQHSDMVIES